MSKSVIIPELMKLENREPKQVKRSRNRTHLDKDDSKDEDWNARRKNKTRQKPSGKNKSDANKPRETNQVDSNETENSRHKRRDTGGYNLRSQRYKHGSRWMNATVRVLTTTNNC